ncbi:hypothetical protein MMC29_004816, partial [Sticta canariensis]|nr:hypothetical protein [Sticta canariensis]
MENPSFTRKLLSSQAPERRDDRDLWGSAAWVSRTATSAEAIPRPSALLRSGLKRRTRAALPPGQASSSGCVLCVGRELFALAWVVEAASPAIARTLAGISDLDSVAISVPDVPTVPTNALYGLFAQVLMPSPPKMDLDFSVSLLSEGLFGFKNCA